MSALIDRIRSTGRFQRVKSSGGPLAAWAWFRFQGGLHYAARGHLARRRALDAYLKATSEPRLHIGAGSEKIPGWLDSDIVAGDLYLDLTRPLPLPTSSFQFIFGEHVIEHLDEADGAALMIELRRVLRPGGILRMTTPDLRKIIMLYEDRNPVITLEEFARWMDQITPRSHVSGCQVFNNYMREWGHRFVYDEEELTRSLTKAGFVQVDRLEPGESEHPALVGVERHGPEWENRAEAMCLEAKAGS